MRNLDIALSLAIFIFSLGVFAQSPSAVQAQASSPMVMDGRDVGQATAETFSARVREVSVLFSASDWRGHFVSNLRAADLRVFDNGQQPESIAYFLRQENLPLKIEVLIDVSDSVVSVFRDQQKAAVIFLQQTLRPSDSAALITFGEQTHIIQDFTSSLQLLTAGIKRLTAGETATAMYDAVKTSCEKFDRVNDAGPTRHALILITDGDDNHSRTTRNEAIYAALQSDVVIFALNTSPSPQDTDSWLRQLSENTGGAVLHAGRSNELRTAFRKINEELRNQYLLGYKPPLWSTDRSFHKIRLATHRFGLRLHCRKGYYEAD